MMISLQVGIIPEGTTAIEGRAFFRCMELTKIVIHDSVSKIGKHSFYDCTGLDCCMCLYLN